VEKLKAGLKEICSSLFAAKGYVEARHQIYTNFLKKAKTKCMVLSYLEGKVLL